MKHFKVNGDLRTDLGKKASKEFRRDEKIPCVIYGGEKNINFTVLQGDIRKFIYTPNVMFADITVDGKEYITLLKDIQFHPVSDKILHIDFYEINPEKEIKIKIPAKFTGSSIGVKLGGKVKQPLRSINIKGLMENIPDFYEIDITKLKIGDSIRVRDLKSETLEFLDAKSNIVVTVASSRGVVVADVDVEGDTTEEAETPSDN